MCPVLVMDVAGHDRFGDTREQDAGKVRQHPWTVTREARDMRERRAVDRLGSHLIWSVSLIPPVSRSYPMGVLSC